ncbi:MAG: tannase/feruloyl esterase family alpha/beta hydrolase [Clostridia bacterium]|nr:tannase/feruloyl esterase family alpha/beta hydrolase [Clostridia bacterium]
MERDNQLFYDVAALRETPGIRQRANAAFLQRALDDSDIKVTSVSVRESGVYRRPPVKITGLPPFVEVTIRHRTGVHEETVTVWSPLAWNDRFIGTGGGGTATGGAQYIKRPRNTSRGQTLPKAVMNGFTAATTDAGNGKKQWAVQKGVFDWERYENWRSRSTHFMTVIGKRIAEILHERPVQYSYFHGGSGGGRQAMVEAQEWPKDYDGIWASCPAINWTKFLTEGYWALAVMNDAGTVLPAAKMKRMTAAVRDSVGGEAAFYRRTDRVDFDPFSMVGKDGFTKTDAEIIRQLWDGPRRPDGSFLWYSFRPGVQFWNVVVPVGGYYYQLLTKRPRPFFLSRHHLCWVTENERFRGYDMTRAEFVRLFDRSVEKFSAAAADNADLSAFRAHGGKLMIDHGTADPLIPVDGTIDYWRRVEHKDDFLRLYITPGDGHGTCDYFGPGLTETTGMRALIAWVEQGKAPAELPTVRVNRKGMTIKHGTVCPYEEGKK